MKEIFRIPIKMLACTLIGAACTIASFSASGQSKPAVIKKQDSSKCTLIKANTKTVVLKENIDSVDRILSIKALGSSTDTVNAYEIVAIKLKTDKPIKDFVKLFADGLPIEGLQPWKVSEQEKTVFFKLGIQVQLALAEFIDDIPEGKQTIPVYFSVATKAGHYIKAPADPTYVEVRKTKENFPFLVLAIAALILMLVYMSLRNHILKDEQNHFYSLGRLQLFYWTIIFAFCYLFIWYFSRSMPDVTSSALIILGISAATTVATKVIENNREDDPLNRAAQTSEGPSEGWLKDILSDDNGISINRFQNVVFNLVFGVIFIERAVTAWSMPEFDSNALLLMGISSTTYAGLKISEKSKPAVPPAPQAPPIQ